MQIPGYKIERLIAEGGMASVYLAVQESLDRPVALKLLRKFDNPAQAQRFLNEGKIIASLEHRNIITIYDLGVVGERNYLAMEFLAGGDLRSRINDGMSPGAVLEVLETLGNCLSFVHQKGIIHRDIKPENILFRQDGTVVLTDFGVAKHLEADTSLTMDGTTLGSPHYLSPEQAESKPLDGRADIYSLGIVFYEMLTGLKPFQGDSSIEIIIAHLTSGIPLLPPAQQCYQPLLARMIAKDPTDRFASAQELVAAVQDLRNSLPPQQMTEERSLVRILQKEQPSALTHTVEQQFPLTPVSDDKQPSAFKPPRVFIRLLVTALLAAALLLFRSTESEPPIEISTPTPSSAVLPMASLPPPRPPAPVSEPVAPNTATAPATAQSSNVAPPAVEKPPAAAVAKPVSVKQALREAEKILNDKSLTLPKLKLAHDYYQIVLKKQPRHPEALGGANIIANHLIALKLKIERYLTAAEKAEKVGKLAEPEKNSALDYYRRILELAPDHPEALQGIDNIVRIYADRAEIDLNKTEIAAAELNVRFGLSIQPENPKLLALEEKIKTAAANSIHPDAAANFNTPFH